MALTPALAVALPRSMPTLRVSVFPKLIRQALWRAVTFAFAIRTAATTALWTRISLVVANEIVHSFRATLSHIGQQLLHHMNGTSAIYTPDVHWFAGRLTCLNANMRLPSTKKSACTLHDITIRHADLNRGQRIPRTLTRKIPLQRKTAFAFQEPCKPGSILSAKSRVFPFNVHSVCRLYPGLRVFSYPALERHVCEDVLPWVHRYSRLCSRRLALLQGRHVRCS